LREYAFIKDKIETRKGNHLLRELQTITPLAGVEVKINGRKMINFCSNDYLGLSKHPLLQQRAMEYMRQYGAGSTASRLVCGNVEGFDKIENSIARLTEKESALVFNSGFQTNVSIIPALADKETLILSDELNHNSIIQGALLSRCRVEKFRHNNMNQLEDRLKQNKNKGFTRTLILTESVFSMDGDTCKMETLSALSETYEAILFVDEAHAAGVLGKNGMGLTTGKNVDIAMGTFSKAAGSFGAYVACSNDIKDYLVNFCNGLIYTTALPPSVLGTIDAALELIPGMESERKALMQKADYLRLKLNIMGFNTGNSSTQIIPVIIGDEKETLDLSEWLRNNHILAVTFRPPTVPKGESRIRLSLSASHTMEHIKVLIDLFKNWQKQTGYERKSA